MGIASEWRRNFPRSRKFTKGGGCLKGWAKSPERACPTHLPVERLASPQLPKVIGQACFWSAGSGLICKREVVRPKEGLPQLLSF